MEQVAFPVNASAEEFAKFLCLETKDTNQNDFPHFSLCAGVNEDNKFVVLQAHLKVTKLNEGEVLDLPKGGEYLEYNGYIQCILFELRCPTKARTLVKATVFLDDALPYFRELLAKVANAYPEPPNNMTIYGDLVMGGKTIQGDEYNALRTNNKTDAETLSPSSDIPAESASDK